MLLNIKTIDDHSHQKKTQIICNDVEGHKTQHDSLPPEKKITILQTDADAHKKKWESLSPEDKDLFDKNHTAAQNKHCKSLASDQNQDIHNINLKVTFLPNELELDLDLKQCLPFYQ